MKILIVTHFFPPLNRVATSRPYSWAQYWAQNGHEICVLTTKKEKHDGPLNFNRKSNENFRTIEVPRIKGKNNKEKKGLYYWILPAYNQAINLYKEWPFDVVVSTFGPPISHLVSSLIKRKLGILWVADYRDLWSENPYGKRNGFKNMFKKFLENITMSNADVITTVSNGLAKVLKERFKKPTFVVANGFEVDDLPYNNNFKNKNQSEKIRLVYTGTIYPGQRDADLLFSALNLLKAKGYNLEDKLEIVFFGDRLGNTVSLAEKYGVNKIIKTPGFVTREQSLEEQKLADYLLYFDWYDEKNYGVIPAKLFEYLFSGTPVIGIGVHPKSESYALLEEIGGGIVLENSAEKIMYFFEKIITGESLKISVDNNLLSNYTREKLANKMLAIIKEQYKLKN